MDSYILTVEKAICSLIADTVTTDNGRPFDLSQVVFRGRQRFGHGEPVPMVSVVQAPNIDIENNNAGKGRQRFSDKTFLIQGWVADDPQNPTDPAHELMAEVKRALSYTLDMDDPNFMFRSYNPKGNDLISNINISTGLVRPPESGISDKAYFWLPLIVTLIEDLSDPYSTP
jgi:hypothetical protein